MKEKDVQYVGENYIVALYERLDKTKSSCVCCKICSNIMFFSKNNNLPLYCNKCKTKFDYVLKEK